MYTRPTTVSRSIAISVDGRLAEDRACQGCGYNLRTMHAEARCPECNAPVAESLVGTELVHADAEWLRTIMRGVKLMAIAVTGALALFAAIFISAIALSRVPGVAAVLGLAVLALPLLFLVGVFMVTRTEPRLQHQVEGISLRKSVRIFAVATLAFMALVALLRFATSGNVFVDQVMVYAPTGKTLLISITLWILADYFVALMRRTAAEKVVKSMVSIRTGVRAAVLIWFAQLGLTVFVSLSRPAATQPSGTLADLRRTVASCGSCVAIVTFIAAASALWKVHAVLRDAQAEAAARERAIARATPIEGSPS